MSSANRIMGVSRVWLDLMTSEQIAALASTGESETLEFKATTGMRRSAVMTVCAMLNQRGGRVLFGVTPQGVVVGQQVSERTIEELSAEVNRIDPPAFPEVERVRVSGEHEVIAVNARRGASPPYQYRGASYRRVGNTTRAMSAEEYNRMLFERMHNDRRWENQPAPGWTIDDLDVAEVRNTVAEAVRIGRLNEPGSRDPGELLRGLGLLRGDVLFRAAAVLFGSTERLECEIPSVCSASHDSGGVIDRSFWTTDNSTAMHSRCLRARNAFCAIRCRSLGGSSLAASHVSTNRSTHLLPYGKLSRTLCAIATI